MLLGWQPEGASHDADSCDFCNMSNEEASAASNEPASGGSAVSEKTYTEGEYNALQAQVEDLEGKVAELTASTEASQVDAAVAAATSDLEAQVADLQSKLDGAVLEASTAASKYDEVVSYIEAIATEQAAAEEAAARKDARVAAVKEVASFPDSYLEENADRFAAMSDEQFEITLDGFKAQQEALAAAAASTSTSSGDEIPAATAMTAARTNEGSANPFEVMHLRGIGVDPRTI